MEKGSYREVEYLMLYRDMELTSSSVQLLIPFPKKKILLPLTCQPTNPFPKRRSDEYSYSLPPLLWQLIDSWDEKLIGKKKTLRRHTRFPNFHHESSDGEKDSPRF